ncbi:MAG: DUF2851 family protein [Dehalococcoidia bacterium]|nr:DUF2851 family protein [Dehalococcoidia bacterium]
MSNTVPDKHKRAAPKEAEVARLWNSQAVRSRSLRTTDGERLQVLYPGRPRSEAGPDFKDALVVTQRGGLLQGDVEAHVDQRGWRTHGHHRDPRYNGVILHVVLYSQKGAYPSTGRWNGASGSSGTGEDPWESQGKGPICLLQGSEGDNAPGLAPRHA